MENKLAESILKPIFLNLDKMKLEDHQEHVGYIIGQLNLVVAVLIGTHLKKEQAQEFTKSFYDELNLKIVDIIDRKERLEKFFEQLNEI